MNSGNDRGFEYYIQAEALGYKLTYDDRKAIEGYCNVLANNARDSWSRQFYRDASNNYKRALKRGYKLSAEEVDSFLRFLGETAESLATRYDRRKNNGKGFADKDWHSRNGWGYALEILGLNDEALKQKGLERFENTLKKNSVEAYDWFLREYKDKVR